MDYEDSKITNAIRSFNAFKLTKQDVRDFLFHIKCCDKNLG